MTTLALDTHLTTGYSTYIPIGNKPQGFVIGDRHTGNRSVTRTQGLRERWGFESSGRYVDNMTDIESVEWWDHSKTTVEINDDDTMTVRYYSADGTRETNNRYDLDRAMSQADGHQQLARAMRLGVIEIHNRKTKRKGGAMAKDRPEHEATAQAKLDGHTTAKDARHEGFHLGDESGRRAGAGQAGEGSNRSARDQ